MEQQDIIEMQRLMSLDETTKEDWDSTFNLYRKYINSDLQSYKVGCGCGNAIENLFIALKNFYLQSQS